MAPQTTRLRSSQVANSAGGFVFALTPMKRLHRFLCLGSETGTFYAKSKDIKASNVLSIQNMLADGKGLEVVDAIIDFSVNGRAAKTEPGLLALALTIRLGDKETKKAAFMAIEKVCRIPTHLFQLVDLIEGLQKIEGLPPGSGWGRGLRKAVCLWYLKRSPTDLALAVTKYQARESWSHRDLLRLAHPRSPSSTHSSIFAYCVADSREKRMAAITNLRAVGDGLESEENATVSKKKKSKTATGDTAEVDALLLESTEARRRKQTTEGRFPGTSAAVASFLEAVESAKVDETTVESLVEIIHRNGLVREHIPTKHLSSASVWEALLEKMPLTAMVRNLNKLTEVGVLAPDNAHTLFCCARLTNPQALKSSRLHPLAILLALKTYGSGHGFKGSLRWDPVPAILIALEAAFYQAFGYVTPTNQRLCIALDVSGSMGSSIAGTCLSAREAAAALAMLHVRTETHCDVVAFSDNLVAFPVSKTDTLQEVSERMSRMPFGATDCALPMRVAMKKKIKYNGFIVITDCETFFGQIHPSEAMLRYREKLGVPEAKLVVLGLTSTGFTIADPEDAGMMDFVGMDAAAPQLISDFLTGLI